MTALITINGNGNGCIVTACIERYIVNRINGEYAVNTSLLPKGVDSLLSVGVGTEFIFGGYAQSSSTRLDIEKPYIWSRHALYSNVPIKTYCRHGVLGSLIKLIKEKMK